MRQQTISEALFESYCSEHELPLSRIPTESYRRTPDYSVTFKGETVIAEVKQFDPTGPEARLQKELDEKGFTEAFGGSPGRRASQKIKDGMKQLRLLAKDKYATLLVLYNNVPITKHHVHPYAIKTTMYGLEEIALAVPCDASPWVIVGKFGGRRRVTPTQNTTLSAVAVLHENHGDGSPYLDVFHNMHAVLRISPEWLRNPETRHFKLDEKDQVEFQEWIEV